MNYGKKSVKQKKKALQSTSSKLGRKCLLTFSKVLLFMRHCNRNYRHLRRTGGFQGDYRFCTYHHTGGCNSHPILFLYL